MAAHDLCKWCYAQWRVQAASIRWLLCCLGCANVDTQSNDVGVKMKVWNTKSVAIWALLLPLSTLAAPPVTSLPDSTKLSMPAGFQGRWASALDVANAHKVCRNQYHGDDAATVKIDAARNRIHVQFYENEAQLRWLSFKDKTATQVRGDLNTVTRYEGDDADTRFTAAAQMVLQNHGRQMLTKNVLQNNTTRVLVFCGP